MEGNRRIKMRFVIKILIVYRLQVGSLTPLQRGMSMIFVHSYLTMRLRDSNSSEFEF